MSRLTVYPNDNPAQVLEDTTDPTRIAAVLAGIGVDFERWDAPASLAPEASQEEVLAAYAPQVEKLKEKYGFNIVDVVGLHPAHPEKEAMRAKFLDEHTHNEFETRFFVDGQGLFVIHAQGRVFGMLCTRGDLINLPEKLTHWFDMGSAPHFKAIRFFKEADGWVGTFTQSGLARQFPGLA